MTFVSKKRPPKRELAAAYRETGSIVGLTRVYGIGKDTASMWLRDAGIRNTNSKYAPPRDRHLIPTKVFGPILRRLIEEYSMCVIQGKTGQGTMEGTEIDLYHRKCEMLAPMIGTTYRRLEKTINEEQENIMFETADKITTFFQVNHLWWEEPLCHHYFGPEEEVPEAAERIWANGGLRAAL